MPGAPRGINSEGLKRREFSSEQIRNIKKVYRILYRSDLKLDEAKAQILELAKEHTELEVYIDFFAESTRSVVR